MNIAQEGTVQQDVLGGVGWGFTRIDAICIEANLQVTSLKMFKLRIVLIIIVALL